MTNFLIARLAKLVGGWKETTQVKALVLRLDDQAMMGKTVFAGAPLPDTLIAGKLPPGIKSAWAFVQRPKVIGPAHKHPNSIQHMALIAGTGMSHIGKKSEVLQPFDPAYPEKSIYVIPENTPHAFESFNEPLVFLSFHTVVAEKLVEVDIATGTRSTYL